MRNESKVTRAVLEAMHSARRAYQDREYERDRIAARFRAGLISAEEAERLNTAANYALVEEEDAAAYLATWTVSALADGRPVEGIRIDGHRGRWYVVDVRPRIYGDEAGPRPLLLLQHETYGDETGGLLVSEDYSVVLDDVWNGYGDFDEL